MGSSISNQKQKFPRPPPSPPSLPSPPCHPSISGSFDAEGLPPITVVCISDTHADHRAIKNLPPGDILLHAGDYTCYGSEEHAIQFNEWLREIKHNYQHVVVVNGNHESNATWRKNVKEIVSEPIYLINESINLEVEGKGSLLIHGTQMYYRQECGQDKNEHYERVPKNCDLLVTHHPASGMVDGNRGCPALRSVTSDRTKLPNLQAVVGGHFHFAHGVARGDGVTYVNAAICGNKREVCFEPEIILVRGRERGRGEESF